MVKTGVFKKIAALTAAVTVIGSFAAVASAATVATTTTYTDATKAKIRVTASVTDVTGAEVTYYATKGDEVVYVDQQTANDGSAVFTYVTDATDLEGNVKVGQTGATTADTAEINGYTVNVPGTALTVPTENVNGAYEVTYTPAEGKKVTGLNATSGTATLVSCEGGKLNFTLADATGDTTITTVEEDIVVKPASTGSIVDSAAIVAGEGNDTDEEAAMTKAGDRKLTVIGQVSNAVDADFGVIVTTETITEGNNITTLPEGAYAATGASAQGYYAVQLIDTATENADFIVTGTAYNTAVYFKNVDNTYTIIAGKTVTAN